MGQGIAVVTSRPEGGLHDCIRAVCPEIMFPSPELAPILNLKVAFMRCAYEIDLNTPALMSAMESEHALSQQGCRLVNPPSKVMNAQRKDLVYQELEKHRIPVPRFRAVPTIEEALALVFVGAWKFPFMYRAVDSSGGKDTWVVRTPGELRLAYSSIQSKRGMLVEFIDSRSADPSKKGLYRRWRFFVIGNRVDQYTLAASKNPIIRHESAADMPAPPEGWVPHLVRIGTVLGIQVYCVDVMADERHWAVVDVNPTYTYSNEPIQCPPHIQALRDGHAKRIVHYLMARGGA